MSMELKHCPSCHRELHKTAFGRNRQTPDGLNYYCKECAAERQREWTKQNPEKVRAAREKYLNRLRATNALRDDPYTDGLAS